MFIIMRIIKNNLVAVEMPKTFQEETLAAQ